jgi:DNA helicase-2/ATP-dependent DNA helicase PcrA
MRTYRLKVSREVSDDGWDPDSELDAEQREVVEAPAEPLLVVAGAGTGKTRALTYRVARLIRRGTPPERVLLCTFTNRAAREMTRRVEALTGVSARAMYAGTFHHVANRLLRELGDHVGLSPGYGIIDREDCREIIGQCVSELGSALTKSRFPRPGLLLSIFSLAANRQLPVQDVVETSYPRFRKRADQISEVAAAYAQRKGSLNVVDFDDLLLGWLALMTRSDEAATIIGERFAHVLVDEYQDVNQLQANIVDRVARRGGSSITVVGDDAQSIYSFRGASVDIMLDFPKRFPDARVLRLQTNYRSGPKILELANRSIEGNINRLEKTLRAHRTSGTSPVCLAVGTDEEQACFVCQRLLELHHEESIPLREIAVLYRAHSHSMELQVELGRRNIPFAVRSGLRFFEQAHIKDVFAYLRALHNPTDELALARLFQIHPGVGRATSRVVLESLRREMERGRPIESLAAHIDEMRTRGEVRSSVTKPLEGLSANMRELGREVNESGVGASMRWLAEGVYKSYASKTYSNADERLEDIMQLALYAERFHELEPFLSEIALAGGVAAQGIKPGKDPDDDHLTLSTIHQAKGLEWRVVFLIGLCEGMFPSALALRDLRGEEEERRLFHVAATRAKDELYLCRPTFSQSERDFKKVLRPSRFLTELQPDAPFETWEIMLENE